MAIVELDEEINTFRRHTSRNINRVSAAMTATCEPPVWPHLIDVLLDSNYSFELETECDRCLLPIPWTYGDRLPVPYGKYDLPYFKQLLFSSDCVLVGKSLQALVERAHDCLKAMDMLRLDVLSPLNRLMKHAEPYVRQRCCALIRALTGQPAGKVCVVRNAGLVRNLMALVGDAVCEVRYYGAAAVMALAEHRMGNETMVELACADRALYRAYVEPDDRVVLALLCAVGRLTATNRTARERTYGAVAATSLGDRFFGDDPTTVGRPGRVLVDHLMRSARSPDYRTTLRGVTGLARAVQVRAVNAYVARDRGTVDLLVSFVLWSPELQRRAPLRETSVRLLCSLVDGTADGLANFRASVTAATDDNWRWADTALIMDNDDPETRRRLQKLIAAAAAPVAVTVDKRE